MNPTTELTPEALEAIEESLLRVLRPDELRERGLDETAFVISNVSDLIASLRAAWEREKRLREVRREIEACCEEDEE